MRGDHQLIDAETGEVLLDRLELATTYWQRLRGLLFRSALQPGEGLLIRPCRAIHTHGMRYAIDVAMLDLDGAVLAVHPSVSPWRMVAGPAGTRAVLETAAGFLAERLPPGRRLVVQPKPK
jgi:uncharacterized protein